MMYLRFVVCFAIVMSASGCHTFKPKVVAEPDVAKTVFANPPTNVFVSPYYGQLRPRRIVIVTPRNRTSSFREQDKFATALSIGLRQNGVFEAVIGTEVNCNVNAIQSGRFDEHQLVELAQHYNADAVLYGEVTSFSAYDPMSASVSLSLVDARESVVLLSTDGTWDCRSDDTLQHFNNFLGHHQTAGEDYLGSDTQSGDPIDVRNQSRPQSPSEFISFVAFATAKFIAKY